MKTLTIHFMDWAVVRTDNTGFINETGLVSWRKGGDTKVQLVTAFRAKSMDLLAAGGEKLFTSRENGIIWMCSTEMTNATSASHETKAGQHS